MQGRNAFSACKFSFWGPLLTFLLTVAASVTTVTAGSDDNKLSPTPAAVSTPAAASPQPLATTTPAAPATAPTPAATEPAPPSAPKAAPPKDSFSPVYVKVVRTVMVPRHGDSTPPHRRTPLASRSGRHFFRARQTRTVDVAPIIVRYASMHNLDPYLVKAVMSVESCFHNSACSHCGAAGLMQLMPTTGRMMGARDLYDPEQNIAAGTRYLRLMLNQFDGRLTSAIAAYNAGPGNIPRDGSVPNITETRHYVAKVLAAYKTFRVSDSDDSTSAKTR